MKMQREHYLSRDGAIFIARLISPDLIAVQAIDPDTGPKGTQKMTWISFEDFKWKWGLVRQTIN